MIKTLPLKKYCELSGESEEAVKQRINRGHWLYGRQVLKVPNVKALWIDLEAVEEWARQGQKTSHVA